MLAQETSEDRRAAWLGSFAVLSDELLCHLLELFEAQDLARLSCVSRVFYIFCKEEPLWMKLCLHDLDGLLKYAGTWRTSVLERLGKKQSRSLSCNIHADGFSSLFLYRRWYRCNVNLYSFEIYGHMIDRRHNISAEEFAKIYDTKKPVLLNGLADDWPAMGNWSLDYLAKHYGKSVFKVARNSGKKVLMCLEDYISYMRQQHDEEPLYIFDPKFAEVAPGLVQDYKVPSLFEEDLFKYMEKPDRPPFRWLVIGPVRSCASWHIDPALTSAWNTLISGRKRWALYPPGRVPPSVIVHADEDKGEVDFDSPTSLQWWLDVYPALTDGDKPLECVQFPGETIFVPSGWWHCVLNLDDSVAVTHNFVNTANFELVCLDLIPGHRHKAVARAGRLALQDPATAFTKASGREEASTIALQQAGWSLSVEYLALLVSHHTRLHKSNSGRSDFYLSQSLRKWLWNLWQLRLDLRKQIWKNACIAFDAEKLLGIVVSICHAHKLPQPTEMEHLPFGYGSNPVFLVGSYVIKLCLEEAFEDKALDGLASELQFRSILENIGSHLKYKIPQVVTSGVVYLESEHYKAVVWDGRDEPNCEINKGKSREFYRARWNQAVLMPSYLAWGDDDVPKAGDSLCPYIVTNKCDGQDFAHLRENMQKEQISCLTDILGNFLGELHNLPMPLMSNRKKVVNFLGKEKAMKFHKHGAHKISKEWTLFISLMKRQHKHAADRLEEWECAPLHLIRQVVEYLPSDPVELLEKQNMYHKGECELASPVWLHMDITDENLQIVLGPPGENSQTTVPVNIEGLKEHNNGVVKSCTILDFGDVCLGDPLYDLVSVYLDVFRGNSDFFKRFLTSYNHSLFGNRTEECKSMCYSHDLPYRAMCYTILHTENAVGSIFKIWKDLKTASIWKEVEQKVWGFLVDYQNIWNQMH